MIADPDWLGSGVIDMVRALPVPRKTMLEVRTRLGFEETVDNSRASAGVSSSPIVMLICADMSSAMIWSAIEEMNGGSLTPPIITRNVRVTMLLEAPPSSTVTVIVTLPVTFETVRKLNEPEGPVV